MPDLRTLFNEAVARRVIPAPPVHSVTTHAEAIRSRQSTRRLVGAALAVVTLLLAASVTWATRDDSTIRVAARPGTSETTTSTSPAPPSNGKGGHNPSSPKTRDTTTEEKTAKPPPAAAGEPPRPECKAGANGGATDVGVTGNRVRLGMTNTRSGTNSSVVGNAYIAVQAVVNRVNAAGGICGRLLDIQIIDEPSGPSRWPRFYGNKFAELVGPLQPGLDAHIADGTVDRAGVPVVGTDGWSALQFRSPWVWPVGTPLASIARIAVDHAYRSLGSRTFALVYEQQDHWRTAEPAVRQYVATLPGASVRSVQALKPGSSYRQQADDLHRQCGEAGCDAILLALSPYTTESWLYDSDDRGRHQTALLEFLPGRDKFNSCSSLLSTSASCPLDVWSRYTPPVGAFLEEPDVARYHQDMKETDEGVDDVNSFVEGTYVGARVLVEALKQVGPTLTRARFRDALDSMRFESGLVGHLSWRPGPTSARLLRIGETIEDGGTGWVRDPTPGVFPE